MFACQFLLTQHRVSMLAITNCYEQYLCVCVCVLMEVECWDSRLASAGLSCCMCLAKCAINPIPQGVTWAKSNMRWYQDPVAAHGSNPLNQQEPYPFPFRDNKKLNANSFRNFWASLLHSTTGVWDREEMRLREAATYRYFSSKVNLGIWIIFSTL